MVKSIFKDLFKGLSKRSGKSRRRSSSSIWRNASGGSIFGVDKRTRGGKKAWFSPGRTGRRGRKK